MGSQTGFEIVINNHNICRYHFDKDMVVSGLLLVHCLCLSNNKL